MRCLKYKIGVWAIPEKLKQNCEAGCRRCSRAKVPVRFIFGKVRHGLKKPRGRLLVVLGVEFDSFFPQVSIKDMANLLPPQC